MDQTNNPIGSRRHPNLKLSVSQLDRAVGVLVASAAGDALGAGYEFAHVEPTLVPEMIGGGLGGFEPGQWTDDTDMAMAIAEVAKTGIDLRSEAGLTLIAKNFARWFSTGPADVGIQTGSVLRKAGSDPTGSGMIAASKALHDRVGRSAGNGSLMRTGPVAIAYLHDPDELVEAAMAVSSLTHYQDYAQEACAVWCLAIRHAVLTGEFPTFDDIAEHAPNVDYWRSIFAEAEDKEPAAFVQNTWSVGALQAAWSAIKHTPIPAEPFPSLHLVDSLTTAIRIGNDTDTVAAIAGQLLGAVWGASAVPARWRRTLNGWPGLDSLDLERIATMIACHGQGIKYDWPTVSHIDYEDMGWGSAFIVQHPMHDNLYIGSAPALDDLPDYIDTVVSLCLVGTDQVPETTEHISFRLLDVTVAEARGEIQNANLDFIITDAAELIHDLLEVEEKKVFLHCVASHSRTPTVAAAVAKLMGHEVSEALQEIREIIPMANPNQDFRAALDRIGPHRSANSRDRL